MVKKTPLYVNVLDSIKERIIKGIYPIDSLLPTESEFEKEFSVSKITVRKAIQLLENDGYVRKQSGKGTTVTSNSIFNKISKGDSFSKILQQQGARIRKEATKVEKISLLPQDELYCHFNSECTKITRMYYLDGNPYIYMIHYTPSTINDIDLETNKDFSLYMHLYQSDFQINSFEDSFYVEYPSSDIQSALDVDNGPILGRKRITFDIDNNVIEVSHSYYNTKKHPYQIKYQV